MLASLMRARLDLSHLETTCMLLYPSAISLDDVSYMVGALKTRREDLPRVDIDSRSRHETLDTGHDLIIAIVRLEMGRQGALHDPRHAVVRLASLTRHDEDVPATKEDRQGFVVPALAPEKEDGRVAQRD